MNRLINVVTLCLLAIGGASSAAGGVSFNRDIRPILSENCFYCHGQDGNKRKADLRLDDPDSATGKAFVPGDVEASALIQRIYSEDLEERMPPPESERFLSEEEKEMLRQWIAQGGSYERHWAFVAPERPDLPEVARADWVRTPIDRFVLAKLEEKGMAPSPEADRATLIRRLFIDLTGLPPSPEEVDAFIEDTDPDAYEKLIQRLMESEHYGERMALPWLDAARYADSNGFQQDGDTWQWIWRDWVVRALNEDLPFDQFTIWQLAGDLLPDATIDQTIASGFNRNHLLNGEGGAIAEEQRFVILFDRMDTTATTWLGLTMACAQCHDHKYDPITQRDYYSLVDAFNRVPESGTPQRQSARIRVAKPFIELPTEENKARIADFEAKMAAASKKNEVFLLGAYEGWRAGVLDPGVPGLSEEARAIAVKPRGQRSDEENKTLEAALRQHFDAKIKPALERKVPAKGELERLKRELADYRGDQIPRPMIMSDAKPRDTYVLDRGAYLSPTEKVSFATPAFLPPMPEEAPRNRLGLARWLVSPEHPLTARVQVNRMWQHFFGEGIVKTPEDFGVQSDYPVHGDLLDWLAVEFREGGWSMKAMHRLILHSATYRQSSRVSRKHREYDSANRFYARASRFRMPAMILRDWALASSGLLNAKIGGAPVYPYQPDNVWEPLAITKERDFTYPKSSGEDLYRRSLYTFWRRTVRPANMFDASSRQACRVRRARNNTPLHALTTLNDPTWVEAARTLAQRSLKGFAHCEDQLTFAFRRVLGRQPTEADRQRLSHALEKQKIIYRQGGDAAQALLGVGESPRDETLDPVEHAALTAVCLAILNFDEALTRE